MTGVGVAVSAHITLLRMLARKRIVLLVRYPVNTLSQLLGMFVFFSLIFFGGQALSGQALTDSLDGIIVGFFLYTMAITAFSGLAWSVTRESQWGTLEQLYMSPYGFGTVMSMVIVVKIVESFAWGGATLAFMLTLTGESLYFDMVSIVSIGLLALAPAVGLGFVFAALALLYKRVENVFTIINLGFIGLTAAPVTRYPLMKALPISQGSYLLRRTMANGVRLWELPPLELGILVAVAVGYVLVGYVIFLSATNRARKVGVMGHY